MIKADAPKQKAAFCAMQMQMNANWMPVPTFTTSSLPQLVYLIARFDDKAIG